MTANWWDAEEYDNVRMFYPDPDPAPRTTRLPLTTEPTMVKSQSGAMKLRLVNRHPHEHVHIIRGRCRPI